MTLRDGELGVDDAIAAVEATLDDTQRHVRVDRRQVLADTEAYLLVVLGTSRGPVTEPVPNGPRLVDKRSGEVVRLTVPAARARAATMKRVGVSPRRR